MHKQAKQLNNNNNIIRSRLVYQLLFKKHICAIFKTFTIFQHSIQYI